MSYAISWEANGAVKRFFGNVTGDDMIQAVVEIEAGGRFDDMRYVINDLLDATGFSCSSQDVDEIAAVDMAAARTNKDIRIAVVATQPGIIELARQYADSPMNVYPARIFATLADARSWLDAASGARLRRAR